jgi:hypothetical protein
MNAPIPGRAYRLWTFAAPVPLDEADETIAVEVETVTPGRQSWGVFICEAGGCPVKKLDIQHDSDMPENYVINCPYCQAGMVFAGHREDAVLMPDPEPRL